MEKLSRDFYNQDTITVAQRLLGKYLVHVYQGIEQVGKIVEVEAYLGEHDLASHSSKGLTPRTKTMFGAAGHAYVYLIYGVYYCTNVVTESEGKGCAVLLRAIEPVQHVTGKTTGPGLLSKAMSIDKQLNAHDLLSDNFYIANNRDIPLTSIIQKPRIGVSYAKEWANELLRFYIKENPFISKR